MVGAVGASILFCRHPHFQPSHPCPGFNSCHPSGFRPSFPKRPGRSGIEPDQGPEGPGLVCLSVGAARPGELFRKRWGFPPPGGGGGPLCQIFATEEAGIQVLSTLRGLSSNSLPFPTLPLTPHHFILALPDTWPHRSFSVPKTGVHGTTCPRAGNGWRRLVGFLNKTQKESSGKPDLGRELPQA